MKKIISLLLIGIMLFSFSSIALAQESLPDEYTKYYTQAEMLENEQNQIDKYMNKYAKARNRAIYTNQTVSTTTKTKSGFAGGQKPGGTQFPTGGGFWWADNGGPSTSYSIAFGGKSSTFYINFGNASSSGRYVKAPNNKSYYKLYVSKTDQIKCINVYRQETASSPKVLWDTMVVAVPYSDSVYAKVV